MATRPARPHTRSLGPVRSVAVIGLACVAALLAALAPSLAYAAPHRPAPAPRTTPTITQLQRRLGELAIKNSQLVESYNQARVRAHRAARASRAAKAQALKAAERYASTRQQFVSLVSQQYETGGLGSAGALLESTSNADYMSRLTSLGLVSTHMSSVVTVVAQVRKQAATEAVAAARSARRTRAAYRAISRQRVAVQKQISTYRTLLTKLTSAQQYAFRRAQNPAVNVKKIHLTFKDPAVSPKAIIAVKFALAQVGKPYVWGSAGPSTYDCSGLTMASWAAAGVSLPHSAADQYNYGTHVSKDDLEPGDLLFFYSPIGHVTIYIGDGMMVSAPTEGENVSVVPVAGASDYTGATRLP